MNKVILIGRIGKDPETKTFSNGNSIVEFSLATDDSYRNKEGEKVEQTDWHNCKIMFPKQAEIAQKYLSKGMQLGVEGKLKTRTYEDKDGNKRYVTEVIVEHFYMLSKSNKDAAEQTSTESTNSANTPASQVEDDDVPF